MHSVSLKERRRFKKKILMQINLAKEEKWKELARNNEHQVEYYEPLPSNFDDEEVTRLKG